MFTKTAKEVLEPIAEAVSQLILLNSEAELHQTPIPDLREAGVAVRTQVCELVDVGKRLCGNASGNGVISEGINKAASRLNEGGNLLVDTTVALAQEPLSFKHRQQLLESIKQIMFGISEILNVYDDYEVGKVLQIAVKAKATLTELKDSSLSVESVISVLRLGCQLLVQLVHQTNARIDELLSETQKVQLRYAVDTISKDNSSLVSCIKASFQFSNDAAAQQARLDMCDSQIEAVQLVERVVQEKIFVPNYDELFGVYSVLDNNLKAYKDALSAGNPSLADALAKDYVSLFEKAHAFYARSLEKSSGRVSELDALALNRLKAVLCEFKATHAEFMASKNKNDAVYVGKAAANRAEARAAFLLAERAFHKAVTSSVLSSNAFLISQASNLSLLNSIQKAALEGNLEGLSYSLRDFEEESSQFKRQADLVLEQKGFDADRDAPSEDFGLAASIKINADRLAVLQKSVGSAAAQLASHRDDAIARDHFQNVSQNYSETATVLSKLLLHGEFLPSLETISELQESKSGPELALDLSNSYTPHSSIFGNSLRAAAKLESIVESALEWTKDLALEVVKDDDENACLRTQVKLAAAKDLLRQAKSELERSGRNLSDDSETNAKVMEQWAQLETLMEQLGNKNVASLCSSEKQNICAKARELVGVVDQLTGLLANCKPKIANHAAEGDGSVSAQLSEPEGDFMKVNNVTLMVVDGGSANVQRNSHINPSTTSGADPVLIVDKATAALIKKGEIDLVDDAAPRPLSQAEAATNPIKAAALDLRVGTSHWSKKDNTLLQIVDTLVWRLCELGDFHQDLHNLAEAVSRRVSAVHTLETNSAINYDLDEAKRAAATKRGFITGATNLLQVAAQFANEIEPIVHHCTDSRLKLQLNHILEKLLTLVQQLKILAAVKAASPNDNDSEVQIVTCARNIVNSIKVALQFAESATLRISNEELALVKPIGTANETRRRSKILGQSEGSNLALASNKELNSSCTQPSTVAASKAIPKFKRQIYTKSLDGSVSLGSQGKEEKRLLSFVSQNSAARVINDTAL